VGEQDSLRTGGVSEMVLIGRTQKTHCLGSENIVAVSPQADGYLGMYVFV
jgi:hypothetical protein